MNKGRVLFAASEVYPFAKTGGLADVGHSLPKRLGGTFDVTVVLPLYRVIDREKYSIKPGREAFEVIVGKTAYMISLYKCRFDGINFLFVYAPLLCDRDHFYGPPGGSYEDNALRFGLFSHAIVHLARMLQSDIVHLNDWQTALAALLISEDNTLQAKTVYTIHNLAYQGVFAKSALEQLNIDKNHFTLEGVEFYGKLNLMKAGIGYADAVTTVSPTYAEEILTPAFGCGLEGYLNKHRAKLTGIVNGIDYDHFSPAVDPALSYPYATIEGKASNKIDFLKSAGLNGEEKPLFVFIGRFTEQKGLDMLIDALPQMAASPCHIAILGEGEAAYRMRIEKVKQGTDNIYVYFGYDEGEAHRMYAAADFLLMPSLFEPCGLNQMIAMHYGAVPVVHRVGGLADTVHPFPGCTRDSDAGCGIRFAPPTAGALYGAFKEAMGLFGRQAEYAGAAAHNMEVDVSWRHSAAIYAALYRKISKGSVE